MMRALSRGLVSAVLCALAVAACSQQPAAKGTRGAPASKDAPVDVSKLRFGSADCERRFKAIRSFCAEKARGPGWDHLALRKVGNFLEETWCFPPEPGWNCFSGYAREKRGTLWYEVSTLFYDKEWPGVFALIVSAGNNRRDGEWGAQLSYAVQGEHIVGSGFHAEFVRFSGEEIVTKLDLGTSLDYQAEATAFRVAAPGDPDTELGLYYASPESFRKTALARLDALRDDVEKAFAEHRVQKRVYGAYKGRGIPPQSHDEPLSADEEKAALEKARLELGTRRQTLEQNYALFHKLLVDLLPFDPCWR